MNYLTLGIHYPKPEHLQDILDVAKQVAEVAGQQKGLIDAGAWLDKAHDRVIMMSLWDSAESASAARPSISPLIMQHPWSEWERQPSDNMLGMERVA
jgi:quinol monooxygenase YgiN